MVGVVAVGAAVLVVVGEVVGMIVGVVGAAGVLVVVGVVVGVLVGVVVVAFLPPHTVKTPATIAVKIRTTIEITNTLFAVDITAPPD